MNPVQTAEARRRAYWLLSQLYLKGITAVLLPTLRQIPELAAALPTPFDADEAAAAHHTLFSFNLFPYESFFLGTDGLLGGPLTQAVTARYDAAGFAVPHDVTSPDHVGLALAFLAFLTGAETDALTSTEKTGRPPTAIQWRRLQAQFLQTHLLRWLPPLVQAIRAQDFPFFAALAGLTLDLVADHWLAVAGAAALDEWRLPAAPDLLSDEQTGLKQIAHFLVTPAYSGLYLSRADVARLGRAQQLPRGFGGRAQMLTNLLQTAVTYDQIPAILDALLRLTVQWESAYRAVTNVHPTLSPFIAPWQQRCRATQQLLANVKRLADLLTVNS